MKFTLKWLQEHISFAGNTDELSDILNKAGLEVESNIDFKAIFEAFSIAYVDSCVPHPNADKLNLCSVETKYGIKQVVCGAHNVRAGIYVVYASEGAIVPSNGMVIKPSKIRDVMSYGMLCSAGEIGLHDDYDGIIEMQSGTVGDSILNYIGRDDAVIDIDITPNRGDCLGVRGVAQDIASITGLEIKPLKSYADLLSSVQSSTLHLNRDISKGAVSLVIDGIDNTTKTPGYIKNRLDMVGVATHNPVVDILNYLMLEFNQPMHAFAIDSEAKDAIDFKIDFSKAQESFKLLNGDSVKINPSVPLSIINDKVVAVAGIMGGYDSSCTVNTKSILIECAHFHSNIITAASRSLNVSSDASYRYARKTNHSHLLEIINIAANMILDTCSGQLLYLASDISAPEDFSITLHKLQLNRYLGSDINLKEVEGLISLLGFKVVSSTEDQITFKNNQYRPYIVEDYDLIAEFIRVYGIEKLAKKDNLYYCNNGNDSESFNKEYNLKKTLASLGMNEVMSLPFTDIQGAEIFNFSSVEDALEVRNPISENISHLRSSIIPSLMNALKFNFSHSSKGFASFEIGSAYSKSCNENLQQRLASGVLCGPRENYVFSEDSFFNIYDAKMAVFNIFTTMGIVNSSKIKIITDNLPDFLNPYNSGLCYVGNILIGYFGSLKPSIATGYMKQSYQCCVFEAFIDNISMAINRNIKLMKKPNIDTSSALERDLNIIISKDISWANLSECLKKADNRVQAVNILDIFNSPQAGVNNHCILLRIYINSNGKSPITSEEAQESIDRILTSLSKKFNAQLKSA